MSNRCTPSRPDLEGVECPSVEGAEKIREGCIAYLSDESRLAGGIPHRIYFPRTTEEAACAVRETAGRNERLTTGGARTGIVGGAVPVEAEDLLSTTDLSFEPAVTRNGHFDCWSVHAAAGTTLEELQAHLLAWNGRNGSRLIYPVDPTERSCSLGGNVAANASGARTLHYGPTRDWVLGLTVVLADGSILRIRRGDVTSKNGHFLIEGDDRPRRIFLPRLTMPATKHVAGYYVGRKMDLLDLFVGGEGTLAVITEMDLRLYEQTGETLSLCFFLDEDRVMPLVSSIKGSSLDPLALEYMDRRSLALLAGYREEQGQSSGVPPFPSNTEAVLYTELEGDLDLLFDTLAEIAEEAEVDLDSTWSGTSLKDWEAMKSFRHALPERINSLIAGRQKGIPGLTKIGTDMAVPDPALAEMTSIYRKALDRRGLDYCIFGHIGNGHLHVNILPRDIDELSAARELTHELAGRAVALGGSVAAEHGIGRLKRDFMKIQFSEEEIRQMRLIKEALDPRGTLNPGVLF